ncbi:MAG: DUF4097 family beta strand repeat-containing protein [Tissierellia bacterium]|nr:DUF4097 family beta strand repeat-containing protein [Tissierellia bacterium]
MRRGLKILGILFSLGVLVFVLGQMDLFRGEKIPEPGPYQVQAYDFKEDLKSLSLDLEKGSCQVRLAEEGEEPSISLRGGRKTKNPLGGYSFEAKAGQLAIKETGEAGTGLSFWPFKRRNKTLVLVLPKETRLEDLTLYLDMGDLKLEGLALDRLEAQVDMGSLEVKDLEVLEADLKVDMGSLDWQGGQVQALKGAVDMGSMDFAGKILGPSQIEVDMGQVDLDLDQASSDFSIYKKVGLVGIDIEGLDPDQEGGPYPMDLKLGMGKIRVRFKGD